MELLFKNIKENLNFNEITKNLSKKGYVKLGNINPEYCDLIINHTNILITKNTDDFELNFNSTEYRLWNSHEKIKQINEFYKFSNFIVSKVLKRPSQAYDILAIKNTSLNRDIEGLSMGRWHMDSFNRQLKLFLFLSKTCSENGPLQLIDGSHKLSFKIRSVLDGVIFSFKDFFSSNRSRGYAKIKDEYLDVKYQKVITELLVSKGSLVLVDTSSIHRAKPCLIGERYALTSYYK